MWCRTQSQTGLFLVFRVRCACLRSWWTTFCEMCTVLLTLGWRSRGNSWTEGIFVMPVVLVRELNGLTVFLRPSVHAMCVWSDQSSFQIAPQGLSQFAHTFSCVL